jgi:STAS domain
VTDPRPRAPATASSRAPGIALAGRIGPEDADALATCVCAGVAVGESGPLGCDVARVEDPDMGTVDALARMALAARRLGRNVELRRARQDLLELLVLAGLHELAVEVGRQPEEREEPGGLEEEHDPADSIA